MLPPASPAAHSQQCQSRSEQPCSRGNGHDCRAYTRHRRPRAEVDCIVVGVCTKQIARQTNIAGNVRGKHAFTRVKHSGIAVLKRIDNRITVEQPDCVRAVLPVDDLSFQ